MRGTGSTGVICKLTRRYRIPGLATRPRSPCLSNR